MNDEDTNDAETGEPIAELADLGAEVRSGFVGRVRRRIDRRELTGQLLGFSWTAPFTILIEFLGMIFEMLGLARAPRGGSK